MLTCIAVEDEPLALKRLKEYIGKVPYLELIAEFDNSLKALAFIHSHKPDVLFLDIQMDELSGITLIEGLNYRPQVIFTTAFDQYAVQGFELQVTDYLLKPFALERFLQAAGRLLQPGKMELGVKDVLFLKTNSRLEKVTLGDILYIEGMGDYRCLHLEHGRLLTPETFEYLEKYLPQHQFCRVHKSYLVAILKIRLVERDRVVIGKEMIPISKTYKERFYQLISAK